MTDIVDDRGVKAEGRSVSEQYYKSLPRRRMGAGMLIVDDVGRPLLVEPTYKSTWEIPGGVVETGEDPRTCAAREVREELGLDLAPGRILVMDHTTEPPSQGDAIMLIYAGGVLDAPGSIRLRTSELRSYRFIPDETLDHLVSPSFAFRVRQALHARREGIVIEIINGSAV